ncbi:hypothetical protein FKM82_022462 [Ascaphus truei]
MTSIVLFSSAPPSVPMEFSGEDQACKVICDFGRQTLVKAEQCVTARNCRDLCGLESSGVGITRRTLSDLLKRDSSTVYPKRPQQTKNIRAQNNIRIYIYIYKTIFFCATILFWGEEERGGGERRQPSRLITSFQKE